MAETQAHAGPGADSASTAELIRKALEDVQELARAEVGLAGKEFGTELKGALITTIAIASSISIAVCAIAMGAATLLIALGGTVLAAFACAAAILAVAAGSGVAVSMVRLPKTFLPRTRRRVAEDISDMKDHFA